MVEKPVWQPNNELVDESKRLLATDFEIFRKDPPLSNEHLIDLLFEVTPESDKDRRGWMWILATSYAGYFSQKGTEPDKQKFANALEVQLQGDAQRWGDTWKHRPVEGQLERCYERFRDYKDQYQHGKNKEFTWLKVAGEAVICLARLDNPNYQESAELPQNE